MVSLKDIAQKCGVSTATVSKALNGQPDIGQETRKRITDIADELGYFANSAARALKTNRTYNLGVLFMDEGSRGLTHEYFAAVLNSFKTTAESRGYDITFISNCNIGNRVTSFLEHCRYRGVDGLLIACVDFESPQVKEIISSGLPVVTLDHIYEGKTSILSDNAEGTEALVKFAYSKGHRKIAFIHGENNVFVTKRRMDGFRNAACELGLSLPEEYIMQARYYQPEKCLEEVKKLLALEDRPTCILMPDDFSLMGGVYAIREAGFQIPEDISVIGYDGIVLAEVTNPRITTYKQDTAQLGTVAAQTLIRLIENPEAVQGNHATVFGRIIEGESVSDLR